MYAALFRRLSSRALSRATGSGLPDGPTALGPALAGFFLDVLLAGRDFRDLVIVVVMFWMWLAYHLQEDELKEASSVVHVGVIWRD